MKKMVISFFVSVIFSNLADGQFKAIPGTTIKYADFTDAKGNWLSVEYIYFSKGDYLIAVSKDLKDDFYNLFKTSPSSFEKIFNSCSRRIAGPLDSLLNTKDSSVLKIKFKETVFLKDRKIITGFKEIIWEIENWNWVSGPCYLNIVLRREKHAKPLLLLAVISMACEI